MSSVLCCVGYVSYSVGYLRSYHIMVRLLVRIIHVHFSYQLRFSLVAGNLQAAVRVKVEILK